MNKETVIRVIKGLGYLIMAEVMCLILMLFGFLVLDKTWGRIILSLFSLIIVLGLMANYAGNIGKIECTRIKLGKQEENEKLPYLLAAIVPIPIYLNFIILVISRFEIIPNYLPTFRLVNAFYIPPTLLMTGDIEVTDLNILHMLLIACLVLLIPATIIISYKLAINQIKISEKIMYQNK